MRLIDVEVFLERERQIKEEGNVDRGTKLVLKELDDTVTDYSILSHRWIYNDEVDYKEMTKLAKMENRDEIRGRSGYQKIMKSCQRAKDDGLEWLWVDTCCIDKRNSTELSEALNSMFRWYQNSKRCYAYLHDVNDFPVTPDPERFAASEGWPEWFSRGWTLQELIAPTDLQFFNKDWELIGEKRNLASTLEKITRVPSQVLADGLTSYCPSVAQVMSWAANRRTTRVEDRAYSLAGLLDVNMPMLYGEGKRAFLRLQQEVLCKSTDQTIFAWNPTEGTPQTCGVLAGDPSHFRDCHDIIQMESRELCWRLPELRFVDVKNSLTRGILPMWTSEMQAFHSFITTNVGIQVWFPTKRYPGCPLVLQVVLACRREGSLWPITINVVPWRSKCYRFVGEVGWNPLPGFYTYSQLVLTRELTGAPTGIVIDEVDGVVALLRRKCAAMAGTKVDGRNIRPVGVTVAEIHHITRQVPEIFVDIIAVLRFLCLLPCICIFYAIIAGWTSWPAFAVAWLAIILFWILSEVSTIIPFTCRCTESASPPGEYVISSDAEIVLLRGEERAVASIIRGETILPLQSLRFSRQLTLAAHVALIFGEFLADPSTAMVTLLELQAVATMITHLVLLVRVWVPLRNWAAIQALRQPKLTKYTFGSRGSGVVFALLLLRTEKAEGVLHELLPVPNSKEWRKWKTVILDRIRRRGDFDFDSSEWDDGTWTDTEKEDLIGLFQDARDAYRSVS
ncbi:hypothetical protein F5J12DRAFT_794704 [Pisolithus orientalis]|uniref:uncharacterized protein n=1 Tax=Pisolithus orientalis TaxID=936130 RepID=UPI00222471BD|nr:uncharacterized protein F5J12DRAFT_794704 [Pisolithus orientalis]KAI6035620.1 hypothetical protein F5J12DRAFT_794704 [Pisolithus orientalis]